jgi:copper homeostasis protein
MVIEICTTSLSSIINAQDAGANRLELCENYLVGGVTPNIEFFEKSLEISKIPINILIRPRGGDFTFNNTEFNRMFESIQKFKNYNISGFVVGFLDNKNQLNNTLLSEFRSATVGYELTFHRAFDYLTEQEKSLEQLIENKFDRILCSGSKINSENGIKNLNYLNSLALDKITIMPGGGINIKNFKLFKNAGFNEIHLSAIDKRISLDSNYDIIKEIIEMSQ